MGVVEQMNKLRLLHCQVQVVNVLEINKKKRSRLLLNINLRNLKSNISLSSYKDQMSGENREYFTAK